MSKVRYCAGESCNNRLPGLEYDSHSICATCIGKECNVEDKCQQCSLWPVEKFSLYVKHRRVLKMTRARKARYKLAKANQTGVSQSLEVVQPSGDRAVHNLSQSFHSEYASPSPGIHLPPSSASISLPVPLSAAISAPSRDRVTTELAPDVQASVIRSLANVHSESVSPLSQSVPPTSSVVYSCCDSGVTQGPQLLAIEGLGPAEEPCPVEPCLEVQSGSSQDRGRKRVRETKDVSGKVKRSVPPSRERQLTTLPVASGVNVLDSPAQSVAHSPMRDVTQVTPTTRPVGGAVSVPLTHPSAVRGDGRFSDSMERSIKSLIKSANRSNPNMSLDDSFALVSAYLAKHDPTYSSYRSSRSDRSCNLDYTHELDVSQELDTSDLVQFSGNKSQDKGEGIQQDITTVEVHSVPTRLISQSDSVVHVESISVQSPDTNKLVIDTSLVVLSTPRNKQPPSLVSEHADGSVSRVSPVAPAHKAIKRFPVIPPSIFGLDNPSRDLPSNRPAQFPGLDTSESFQVSSLPSSRTAPFVSGSMSDNARTVPLSSRSHGTVPFFSGATSRRVPGFPALSSNLPGVVSASSGMGPSGIPAVSGPIPSNFGNVPTDFDSNIPVSGLSGSVHDSVSAAHVSAAPTVAQVDNSSFVKPCKPPPAARKPPSSSGFSVLQASGAAVVSEYTFPSLSSSSPVIAVRPRPKLSMSEIFIHDYIPKSNKVNRGTNPSSSSSFPSSVSSGLSNVPASQTFSSSSSFHVVSSHKPSAGSRSQSSPSAAPQLVSSPVLPAKKHKSSSDHELSSKDSDSDNSLVEVSDSESDDLLQISKMYSKLKTRIVSKYVEVKEEKKISERSPFQLAFEKSKPPTPKFKMGSSVTSRIAALDKELEKKRSLASSVPIFQPFLKNRDLKFYKTDIDLDSSAPDSVLSLLVGILDQARIKNLKSTKVSFTISEMDSLIKSSFHLLEVLNFASSSFEILGECFMDLRSKLSPELKPKALEYTSFLRCVDKAGRHSIGEAVNLFANLLIKKREHILNLSYSSVAQAFKAKIVFSPLNKFNLLPVASVTETADQFRRQSETSAIASMVSLAKSQTSKSKSFFRGSGSSTSSASQSSKGKSSGRGRGKSRSKGYSSRNREFFNRRDKSVKNSKPSQQAKKD